MRTFDRLSRPSKLADKWPATVYEVVRFAEDKRTCRKILFARYFANAYDSSQSYDADEADTPCGHCDNVSEMIAEMPAQV